MAAINTLDQELRCSLLAAMADQGLSPEQLARRLGMGRSRLDDLLLARAGFTSRDIMLMMGGGLMPQDGEVSSRRGYRDVRPMVFLRGDGTSRVTRAATGYNAGVDVQCEDISGNNLTVKLSRGLARLVHDWWDEHEA